MARYIDADKLIEYIDKNVVCTSRDSEECKQFMIEHLAMDWFAPTADVVPKSEVEELQAECNKWQERLKTECEYTEGITKKKVAREIFEEIEELSHRFMNDEHYIFGDMVWDIAELKKKYTEGI